MQISIVGSAGIPARYGGFETLAENLVLHNRVNNLGHNLTVYCNSKYCGPSDEFPKDIVNLRYVKISPHGFRSVIYDACSMFLATKSKTQVLLVLGVSGAVFLPLVKALTNIKIVTNIDGVESRRAKWGWVARWFLRFSERIAISTSHAVISDNQGISDHIRERYGVAGKVIPYGGDHATAVTNIKILAHPELPAKYDLSVCRIEPENNIELILRSYWELGNVNLVLVGNWGASTYGRGLYARYADAENIKLLDPIYDQSHLFFLRANARAYVHGHSAGGTNPSLVEAMHFGLPIFAYNCDFNRYTTHNLASFFGCERELMQLAATLADAERQGRQLQTLAKDLYTWRRVGTAYFALFGDLTTSTSQTQSN